MGMSWENRISNTEVLCRADMPGIKALIMKAQLRWVGHLVRKMIFFSELATGARNLGRRLKCYKDCLKASLRACGIQLQGWETLASYRSAWQLNVHQGVKTFEEKRLQDLDQRCQARKDRNPNPRAAVACPKCGRICASNFGLQSHMRIH